MSKVVVFDLDGTLANAEHRMHWVSSKPKNWSACDAAIPQDTLHADIAWILDLLPLDTRVILCTGRSESVREVTEHWLKDNSVYYNSLYMRSVNDFRKD